MSHPTRRGILRVLADDVDGSASTEQLAAALDQPAAKVGYHLKTLTRWEILRLNQDGDRNAAEEDHHRWSLRIDRDWLRVVLDVWVESAAG